MKYVRVYEGDYVESEYVTTYQQHCRHVAEIQDNGFDFEGCIVKQADTIEELCDEFVVDNWEEKNKPILCKYVKEKNALYYCDENGINWLYIPDLLKMEIVIYASIWVDALLKPVAKMNEEGELELL